MATRSEMLIEANKRGLLTGQKKAMFDQAVSRGLIKLPTSQMSDESLQASAQGKIQAPSQLEQARLQSTLVYPEEKTSLGAFYEGAIRGLQNTGFGILQRGSEVADFLGVDTSEFRRKLDIAEDIEQQKFKPTEEARPISAGAGKIAGSVASFPVAPATVPAAVATGGVFGLAQSAEGAGEVATNVAQEALLGGVGAWAAPYLQKGFTKAGALFSGLMKKVTGADPRPEMFLPDGNLSQEGKSAIEQIGISKEDFARIYENLDETLDPIAATRKERAKEFDIDITTGEARRDFDTYQAEESLRGLATREGAAARTAETEKLAQIEAAQKKFTTELDPDTIGREARGGAVQEGLREIETESAGNVRQLYKEAGELPGEDITFNNDSLLGVIDTTITELPVKKEVADGVERLMAKYGLIGGDVEKAGRFNYVTEVDGTKIKFTGEQTPLTLSNAEKFRQGLNKFYGDDTTGAITGIIKEVDKQVDELVSGLPAGSERTEAFQKARAATAEHKGIFDEKDIVQKLVGVKKGTKGSDQITPDEVVKSIVRGTKGVDNIRRVKSVLKNNPTPKSVGAWKSLQAQSVADLFSKSIHAPTGDFSGTRLQSAIKEFGNGSFEEGEKRLKLILDDQYKEFNRLREAIGDATIPIKRTTNPSGTAGALLNFAARAGRVGEFAMDAMSTLYTRSKDATLAQKTLRNIETADPGKVKQAVRANDELIDELVQLGGVATAREEARDIRGKLGI